jgi:hypothetical protein
MKINEHISEELLKLNRQLSVMEKNELREQLILYVNHLLLHDFNKLVSILYRVDVNEGKLRELLQQFPGTDAAAIIADLLIQRQEQKIAGREQFKSGEDIPDNEKW